MKRMLLASGLALVLASPAFAAGSLSITHGGTSSESAGEILGGGLGHSAANAESTTTGEATTATGPNSSTTKTATVESGSGASTGFAGEEFGAGSQAEGGSGFRTFTFSGQF